MCGGTEQSQFASTYSSSITETETNARVMNHLNIETDNPFDSLLEFASENNTEGIKKFIDNDVSSINREGLWYIRPKGSKQVIRDWRTPLMVAATYGSVDVLNLILSYSEVNVNLSRGRDGTTALHCAASGGSIYAVEVIGLLLSSGADPKCVDASGNQPIDVISIHPKIKRMGVRLEDLFKISTCNTSFDLPLSIETMGTMRAVSPICSLSEENFSSPSQFTPSTVASICADGRLNLAAEKKEYPADFSLPDIKSSIYATDEFRMFSFKVRPCSRAYSHDWTDCPFLHPGENARRRDPRKYHYSSVPCPNFKKGPCRHGDKCEYAHGVFESWLHPAQYRTQLCKDGTSCSRGVCFFAHTIKELRPSYLSTRSGGNSVHCNSSPPNVIDMVAINHLPGFPLKVSASTLHPSSSGLSPSVNGVSQSISWPPRNVPSIHLPGSNLHSSRLIRSLGSQNRPCGDSNMVTDFDYVQQISNDLTCVSRSQMNIESIVRSKMQPPSNIDGIFTSHISSSPKFSDPATTSIISPTHKSTALNQCRKQKQIMPSLINQSILSPRMVDYPLLAAFELSPRRRIFPRNEESMSPVTPRFSDYALEEMQHQQLCSLASRNLATNEAASPVTCSSNSWTKCGSPEEVDWSVNGDYLALSERLKLYKNAEEPDLSWIQTLVMEPPPEMIK